MSSTRENGAVAGTALTSNLQAWQKLVDVATTASSSWSTTEANGEGLKNALMYFNDGHLVVSGGGVAWDADGAGGSSAVIDVNLNNIDNFWLTLHQVDGSFDIKGIT